MCDEPVPCACTLERRAKLRDDAIQRQDALRAIWSKVRDQLTEDEDRLMITEVEMAWDDAIHIASPDNPLRSLCGLEGRNLMDLPQRPDSWAGCWSCLTEADKLASAETKELVPA